MLCVRQDASGSNLVFISLLLVADGGLTGHHVEVNVVVAADAPAAALAGGDALELQQHVIAALPLLAGCGEAVNPAVHVHGPQQRDGHDGPWAENNKPDFTL